MHQAPLALTIVRRYKEEVGKQTFKKVPTPGFSTHEERLKSHDDEVGSCAETAPKHVGGLGYLTRPSRDDLVYSVNVLQRHVKDWSRLDDENLERLMAYWSRTQKSER